jgi:hypothetical protein
MFQRDSVVPTALIGIWNALPVDEYEPGAVSGVPSGPMTAGAYDTANGATPAPVRRLPSRPPQA